jgi:hypothetical protein
MMTSAPRRSSSTYGCTPGHRDDALGRVELGLDEVGVAVEALHRLAFLHPALQVGLVDFE